MALSASSMKQICCLRRSRTTLHTQNTAATLSVYMTSMKREGGRGNEGTSDQSRVIVVVKYRGIGFLSLVLAVICTTSRSTAKHTHVTLRLTVTAGDCDGSRRMETWVYVLCGSSTDTNGTEVSWMLFQITITPSFYGRDRRVLSCRGFACW